MASCDGVPPVLPPQAVGVLNTCRGRYRNVPAQHRFQQSLYLLLNHLRSRRLASKKLMHICSHAAQSKTAVSAVCARGTASFAKLSTQCMRNEWTTPPSAAWLHLLIFAPLLSVMMLSSQKLGVRIEVLHLQQGQQ